MKSFLAAILAIFVCTGSIGAPLSVHTCYSIQETELSFELKDHCCENSGKAEQKKLVDACCDLYSTYLQVDFDAFSLVKDFSIIAPFVINYVTLDPVSSLTEIELSAFEVKDPPLLYGRSLLTFVQSFLI